MGENMTKPYKLVPVEKIPKRKKHVRHGLYIEIIEEFREKRHRAVEVRVRGKKPKQIYRGLYLTIRRRKIRNVKVVIRKEKVFLVKV